jgi:hypothetical protein
MIRILIYETPVKQKITTVQKIMLSLWHVPHLRMARTPKLLGITDPILSKTAAILSNTAAVVRTIRPQNLKPRQYYRIQQRY